eukprot:scaffold1627_cov238-Pinguiococcus_pyrenoidosus.AAC.10
MGASLSASEADLGDRFVLSCVAARCVALGDERGDAAEGSETAGARAAASARADGAMLTRNLTKDDLKRELQRESSDMERRIAEVQRDFARQQDAAVQRPPQAGLCVCGYADDDEDVRAAWQNYPAPVDANLELDVHGRAALATSSWGVRET